ncbi:MAG TPA: hypothetical protein PLP65_07070 [Bacteroidales bacterium]|nr:hypothetical protein [Bacteroidales bacterium]
MNKWSIIISLFVLFSSCKKHVENKLIGTWHYYYLSAADTGITQLWTFNNSSELIRVIHRQDSLFYDTATWKVDKQFAEPSLLEISGLDGYFDGTYQILKLNKKFLYLQRTSLFNGSSNGAFLRLEFAKESL